MTFKITKTSEYGFDKNKPPCKNAVVRVEEYERTTFIHDENGQRIKQTITLTRDIWTVEINTLEELMALKKEVNTSDGYQVGLIIFDEKEMPEIEIYDGYRE